MVEDGNHLLKRADVIVIGGGVIGTAITYALARQGAEVCLIDRDDIGAGTTSAAAAAALLQTKTSGAKLALAQKSLSLLDHFHQESEGSFEFEHSGSLLAASNEDELGIIHEMIEQLTALGLDVRYVDSKQARELMPIAGDGIIGASYSPVDAKINPLELVVTYAEQAKRHGAHFYTYTQLTGIERRNDRIVAVNTTRGKIMTDTVVNAAGVWAPRVAELAGLTLPITPLKGELMITEPMPPMLKGTLISAGYLLSKKRLESGQNNQGAKRSVGITLVQVNRGNFLVGSTRENAGYDRRSTFAGFSELCRKLREFVPAIANVHIIRTYAGLRPLTPDGMPIIGRAPELPGFITAAGHGGDGLILSAVTAEIVAGIFTGQSLDMSDSLNPGRFAKQERAH
ncbi:MAG: FAD-binding oxidoreductase [Anaerolineales bacterium]|nr:FAD-binding oxidoreductase [Anaerolineales bacterium]